MLWLDAGNMLEVNFRLSEVCVCVRARLRARACNECVFAGSVAALPGPWWF